MGRKKRVAIMVGLDWPIGHHHKLFAGIQRYAQISGQWDCLINPYADLLFSDPSQSVDIDGFVARATPTLVTHAQKAGIPVVNVWYNSAVTDIPSVFHDMNASGQLAARHLLERGFRNFGFLGYKDLRSSQVQYNGFKEIITSKGFQTSLCSVDHDYDQTADAWKKFQKQIKQWIDTWQKPIGILVNFDLLCRYLAESCREQGLTIPHDVALIGTGNELLIATSIMPTLTSIDQGYEHIGYRAAELLDALMNGAPPANNPVLLPPTSLVTRQSTDAFVVDDPLVAEALRYITEHLHEPINVDKVAAHVTTTRRTLSRRFHNILKQTIHDAITQLRLERVKRALIDSKDPLKSIAVACGFRDAIHLCKVFQRIEGISPSDYRSARTVQHH
jgi:LacI family transcriptional regulator